MKRFIGLILVIFLSFLLTNTAYAYNFNHSFTNLDDETVLFDDYNGTYIVLDAFYTECPPCDTQIDYLKDVYDTAGDQVELFSVSLLPSIDDLEKIENFKNKHNAKWTFGLDKDGSLVDTLNINGFPTTIIINDVGEIIKKWTGITDSETILKELDKHLDLPGALGRSLDFGDMFADLFGNPLFFFFVIGFWVIILISSINKGIQAKNKVNQD